MDPSFLVEQLKHLYDNIKVSKQKEKVLEVILKLTDYVSPDLVFDLLGNGSMDGLHLERLRRSLKKQSVSFSSQGKKSPKKEPGRKLSVVPEKK